MNPKEISLCLITKEETFPKEIWDSVLSIPWGEVLILTHSDSPFRKYELFKKTKFDYIAYQDDDAICPWQTILKESQEDIINVAMKQAHFDAYSQKRMTMGLGWGSVFPKYMLKSLDRYLNVFGEDEIFKRETERILTYLNFPQNRLKLNIVDLPSAYADDRLYKQPQHYNNIQIVEERCKDLK